MYECPKLVLATRKWPDGATFVCLSTWGQAKSMKFLKILNQISGCAKQQVVAHLILVVAAAEPPATATRIAAEVDEVQCEAEIGPKVKKSFGY